MFLINAELNLNTSKTSLRQLVGDIRNTLQSIKGTIDVQVSQKSKSDITQLNRTIQELESTIKNLNTGSVSATNSISKFTTGMGSAAGASKVAASSISNATVATQNLSKAMSEATDLATTFGVQAGLAGRRFLAFSAATTGVFALVRALRSGVQEAIEFDLAINKLKQVSDEGNKGVANLRSTIQDLSKTLGVSSLQLAEAATAFTQAGISAKDSAKAVEAFGLALLTPNFGNAKNTIEGMIALYQQFGKDADNLKNQLGSINAVAGAFASEAEDLITAVQKAGGVFSTTGGKLEELLAIMTSVRATTRESADSIATGLRSIFTYIQRTETVDALKLLNINLRRTREEAEALGDVDLAQQFVGPYEAIQRLSAGLSKLRSTDPRYSQIVEDLGGVRQVSRVLPLIQQFGEAQKALNVARVGSASLETAAAIRQDALVTKLTKIRETYQQLSNDLLQSKGFKSLVDVVGELSTGLDKLLRSLGPLLPVLGGLALGNIAKFGLTAGAAFVNTVRAPSTIIKRSSGGPVPGYGNGDTVPAMLEGGEYVIKKSSAQQIGYHNLEQMNAKGYAGGGQIPLFKQQGILRKRLGYTPPSIKNALSAVESIGIDPSELTDEIHLIRNIQSPYLGRFNNFEEAGTGIDLHTTNIRNDKSKISDVLLHELGHGFDLQLQRQINPKTNDGYSLRHLDPDVRYNNLLGRNPYLNREDEIFADLFAAYSSGNKQIFGRGFDNSDLDYMHKLVKTYGNKAKGFAQGGRVPNILESAYIDTLSQHDLLFNQKIFGNSIATDPSDFISKLAKDNIGEDVRSKLKLYEQLMETLTSNHMNLDNPGKWIQDSGFNSHYKYDPAKLEKLVSDKTNYFTKISANKPLAQNVFNSNLEEAKHYANLSKDVDITAGMNEQLLWILSKHKSDRLYNDNYYLSHVTSFTGNNIDLAQDPEVNKHTKFRINKDLVKQIAALKQVKFANGGPVFGGRPGEDSVNARLMPGEFVLRKHAVDQLGLNNVEHMNQKGKIPGYAKGGRVKRDEDAPFRLPDEAYQAELASMDKSLVQKIQFDGTNMTAKIETLAKAFGTVGDLAEKVTKTVNNVIGELKRAYPGADVESSSALGTGLIKGVNKYQYKEGSTEGGFLNYIRKGILADFRTEQKPSEFRLSTQTIKAVENELGNKFPEGQRNTGALAFLKEHFLKEGINKENEAEKFHISSKPGETLSKILGLVPATRPKNRQYKENLDENSSGGLLIGDITPEVDPNKELIANKEAIAAAEAAKQAKLTSKYAKKEYTAKEGDKKGLLARFGIKAGQSINPTRNLLSNIQNSDYQYSGDDSHVDSILSSIGKSPSSDGGSRYPLVGPIKLRALPPHIEPSLKYALPGGPGGGPGGFIVGDPSQNPSTRGLRQTEQEYPTGFSHAFGLSLNPQDKTTQGYEGGFGLNDSITRNLNLASFNATTAFGLATNRNIQFPSQASPNGPAFIGAGSNNNFTSGTLQGPPRRLGTLYGSPLFNATKDGFNEYANYRVENNLRSNNLYGLRGTSTFDGINQTKLNKEIDALAEGIRRQLKALNIGLTKEERLNASKDLAIQAYEQNHAIVRNAGGQAVGLQSLGSAPTEGFFGRNLRRTSETLGGSRIGRAARYAGSKIGANGGFTAAFGLSTAASFAGDAFAPDEKLLGSQVEAGQEKQYSRDTQIGGTLQGAALGASIGLAAGPYGAAIGGVIGGLYGLTSSLKKASIDISNAKIDSAILKINDQLKPIVSGKNPLSGTNEEELIRNLTSVKNNSLAVSASETSSFFRKTNPDVLAKENQKQLRTAFAGQAGDFAAVLSEELSREAKKPNANADDIFKSFQTGGRGALFQTLTDVRGISGASANKELKEDIRLALQNAQANRNIEKGEDEGKRLATAFSRLTLAVSNATETTDKFKDNLDVISGGTGRIAGLTSGLGQFGAPAGNEFNKSVTGIGNFLGSSSGQLSRTAIAGNQLQSVLPEILAEVSSQGFNDKESESQRVFKLLEKRVDTKNPETAAGIAVVLRGIEEESRKNKGDALRDARVDSSKLSEQLLQPFTGPAKEALEKIGKEFEGFFNGQLSGFSALRGRQGEVDSQRLRGSDLGLNTIRANADLRAESLGGGSGGRLLSFDTLVSPFKQRQASLVEGLGISNAEDPKEIAAKLTQTLQARDNAKAEVNRAFAGGDANATQKAIKDFTDLGYQANRLDQALKTLIDPTQKLAAIQERLSHLQEDRESRLSFGERFINADANERQNIVRGQRLVSQLAQNPENAGNQFRGLSSDNQRLALREARSVGAGQFANGLTGNSLANILIGSTGVTNKNNDAEIKKLLGERVSTAQGAEGANGSLTQVLDSENKKFLSNLDKSLNSFLSRLQLNFSSLNALQARGAFDTVKARSEGLTKQQRQASLLGSVGIDTITGTPDQIDERLRVARSETAKKSLDKFFTARDNFAPYNKNVEEFSGSINELTSNRGNIENVRLNNQTPGLRGVNRLAAIGGVVNQLDIPNELKTKLSTQVNDQFEDEFSRNRKRKGYAGREDIAVQDTLESLIKTNLRTLFGSQQQDNRNQFIKAQGDVSSFGFNANRLGEVQSNDVSKLKEALGAFSEQGQSLGSLNQRIKESEESLKRLKDTAELLQKQFETLNTKESSGPSLFGIPLKRAGGGSLFSPSGSDIVPAMLSPEEFVVNARSSRSNRALLEAINGSNGRLQPGTSLDAPASIPIGPSSVDSLNDKLLSRGGPVYLADGGIVKGYNSPTTEYGIAGRRRFDPNQVGPEDSVDKGNGLGESAATVKGFAGDVTTFDKSGREQAYLNYDPNSEFALDKLNQQLGVDARKYAKGNIGNYVGSRLQGFNNRRQINSLLLQQALAGTDDEIYATGIDRVRNQESQAQSTFNQRFGEGFRKLAEKNKYGRVKSPYLPQYANAFGGRGSRYPGADQYFKTFANGGVVTGGIPGQDSVPALLTPGEVVIPNKGSGGASTGLDKMAEQTNKLANAFVTFNEPALKLSSSINTFSEKSDVLAAALDRFPREVTHTGNFEVNVNHNGAEVFSQLSPEIKKLIVNEASKMIGEEFDRRMPEASSKLKGDSTGVK